MKRLLDDLLDVSRVSQGKIQLQKQRLDLNTLLAAGGGGQPPDADREAAASCRRYWRRSRMQLEADPTRLLQVFANLLNNAAKYTDPGGHIAIIVTVEDGEAVVTVRDDGIGMTR